MIGSFESIITDCPDPRAFARFYSELLCYAEFLCYAELLCYSELLFYSELLGAEVVGCDHDRAELVPPGNPRPLLPFQRMDDYNAPRWPSQDVRQ